jgi:hypothetical protein
MPSHTNVPVLTLTDRAAAALLTRARPRRYGRGLRFRFEGVSAMPPLGPCAGKALCVPRHNSRLVLFIR